MPGAGKRCCGLCHSIHCSSRQDHAADAVNFVSNVCQMWSKSYHMNRLDILGWKVCKWLAGAHRINAAVAGQVDSCLEQLRAACKLARAVKSLKQHRPAWQSTAMKQLLVNCREPYQNIWKALDTKPSLAPCWQRSAHSIACPRQNPPYSFTTLGKTLGSSPALHGKAER
jgi:hypothetical protein